MELYAKLYHNGSDKHHWTVHILPSIMLGNLVVDKGYEITIRWIVWTFRVGIILEKYY